MPLAEMRNGGPMAVAKFWLQLLLFGLTLSTGIFSIYWMALTGSQMWLKAIGGAILATNFFLMVTSFSAFVFLLLSMLGLNPLFENFSHHLFAVCSFVGQVLCCVLLSLSTEAACDAYRTTIVDYCMLNPTSSVVTKYLATYTTSYSQYAYVAVRTVDSYNSIAALFGLWLTATVSYIFVSLHVPPPQGGDEQPLNDSAAPEPAPNSGEASA